MPADPSVTATEPVSVTAAPPAQALRATVPVPGAWAAWGIGVAVYVLAVVHRTSLGVAGLDAAARFGIGASALSDRKSVV